MLALLKRGLVCGSDLEEMFSLYRKVFDLQGMVSGPLYGFTGRLRCEDVPEEWRADYTAFADQDMAAQWLASAAPGSVCLASRLEGVGRDLQHAFFEGHRWTDCAITFMDAPLGSFVSIGAYRRGCSFSDEERTLMSLLHPYMGAALGTELALRALTMPRDEGFAAALERFEGHVFVTWPKLEVVWSARARELWQELLVEPASAALWGRVEDVLRATVQRFVVSPFATRSVRVFRGVRAELAAIPAEGGEQQRFLLLFVREREPQLSEDGPILQLLGERQRLVALAAARGRSLKLIASDLGISLETARSHLKNIYRRLGVESRVELRSLLELD